MLPSHTASLGAVLIVCACGSPAATPTPAPAPAPATARPDAAARLSIENVEHYYDIEGSSAGALREQIHRLGPKDGGAARDALTVWTLDWAYRQTRTADECALRDVRVTLNVTITLPRWAPPAGVPARLLDAWRAYLQHVKLHEAGHRAIAEQNARDLMTGLVALRRPTCQELWDEASRTGERIVAEGRAKNRAYDVETKHGQTQGVELPP